MPPLLATVSNMAEVLGTSVFVIVLLLAVAIALLGHLRGWMIWRLSSTTGERLICEFRSRLFAHVQRLSIGYHESRGTTESMYRIQQDAASVKHIPIDGMIPSMTAICMLFGMIWATARLDLHLALVGLIVSPVLLVLTRRCACRLRFQWSEAKAVETSAMNVVQEALDASRVVKAFTGEAHEQTRFTTLATQCAHAHRRLAATGSGYDFLISMVMACGTAAALFVGVRHVQMGSLSLSEFLLAMAYLSQLYSPLETITKKVGELQSSLAGFERACALLDEQAEVPEVRHPQPLHRAIGAIEFEHVSFAYASERPILEDVSLTVLPGMRVGIIGYSGTGKSTLLHLMTRFFDPTAGRILLDGRDLREYRLADLRRQFAVVLQEPVLFSGSIAENILYGRPDASFEEIIEAAQAARAHDFIRRLPEGYNTPVGSRGAKLSGGERQRISLARAFLRDAPILILDEPTSAVDVETEEEILQALDVLMQGRTTFLVTHRLGALRACTFQIALDGQSVSVAEPAPFDLQAVHT